MTMLIGMREGETLSRLLGMLPPQPKRRLVVNGKEAFFAASREPFDTVVVHTELFADMYPWEWIGRLGECQPGAKIVAILGEAAYDSLWTEVTVRLCASAGIGTTPLGASLEELAARVLREETGEVPGWEEQPHGRSGIVATVWSAACKDGATTIASSAALTLARHCPELSVGLLDLNFKNPELRVALRSAETGGTNAPLRPKLQTGALTPEELHDACVPYRRSPNLRLLYGTHRRDTAGDVSAEMMETLLRVARRTFDVTILDASSYPDNAATVCGVRGADVRWLVAGNRSSSYLWNWSEWYSCYWKHCGMSAADIELVCNRYDPAGEAPEKAAAALGMGLAGIVPNVAGGAGLHSIEEGKPLIDASQAEQFRESIYRLGNRLLAAAGRDPLPERESPRRRPRLVSLLSGLF